MKALVVGAAGQLGRALVSRAPADVEVVALGSDSLDITDAAAVGSAMARVQPQILFNAAAYTAVDQAEEDEAAAMAVNAGGVANLADAARDAGARFVHISTDFVYDGRCGTPYTPDAAPAPLGVYGRSKLAGERLAGDDALIVRTAWLYAATGRNFPLTMLRLMRQQPEVRVVADQIGTPTYAPSLAAALWVLARSGCSGIHHFTDSGVASWYDVAVAIQEEALAIGLLARPVPILPIRSADYPTPAPRPPFSVLDKTATFAVLGGPAPHWRENLRVMLKEHQAIG